MDWKQIAIDFGKTGLKPNYDNISDLIDSLVPIYYYDIMQEANRLSLFHYEVEPWMEGKPVWKILQHAIFEHYFEKFMENSFWIGEEE
jgi:hypothetical protein